MIFYGTATALLTPFLANTVDFEALEKLVDLQLESGVGALVALGTTGEPSTLLAEEGDSVIRFVAARAKGRVPLIVGVGSNCTRTAAELAVHARELGANALLAVTPYYNKCTQEGLRLHYREIARAGLPVICYNVPSRTGVDMLPSTFAALVKEGSVQGVKEASGNIERIQQCVALADGADVYSGDDALAVPSMAMGAKGVISVAANVLPRHVCKMTSAALSNDFGEAARLQLELLPFIKMLFKETNPIPVKYVASLMGIGDGGLRLPLTPLSEGLREEIANEFRALNAEL